MRLEIRLTRGSLYGFALFACTGCYTYPYAPNPGMYAPQGNQGYPPMTVPQSTFVMPGDVVGSPSGSGFSQSEFIPSASLGAPEPVAPGITNSAPGVNKPVPTPRDLDAEARRRAHPDERTSENPLSNPIEGAFLDQPVPGDFREPIIVASTQSGRTPELLTTSATSRSIPAMSKGGFAHDPEFRWFQGIIEYDGRSRTWHLIYDGAPAVTDPLGGEVTLGGNLGLRPSDSGQAFHVVGQFDGGRVDALGKAVYRVSRIERLAVKIR